MFINPMTSSLHQALSLSFDIDYGYIGELVAHGGTISRAREGHDSLSTLATLGDRKS